MGSWLAGVLWMAAAATPPPLLGLVTLKDVVEVEQALPAPIPVSESPDAASRPLASQQDFDIAEIGYEEPALRVYAIDGDWFRVGLAGESLGWVPRSALGDFHALETLLPERFTYLTAAWDRRWSAQPEGPLERDDAAEDETVVTVKRGLRREDGQLWLEVIRFEGNPCEGDEMVERWQGWIPAHDARGQVTVWYWSRGC